MALTLETFMNFESGTIHECGGYVGTPTVVTSPAPPQPHETYCVKLASGGGDDISTRGFGSGNNKYAIGFFVRFSNVTNPAPNWFFFSIKENKVINCHLYLVDGGAIGLYDADELEVETTATGVLQNDTWHLIELLFTKGDPGSFELWVGDWNGQRIVNRRKLIDASGEDFDGGGSGDLQVFLNGQGGSPPGGPCDTWVKGPYVYSGATDSDDLVCNNAYFESLTYRRDEATATPNAGVDDLDAGNWDDAAEIPFNDANFGRYSARNRVGVVTTNFSGGSAIPGPYGDSRIGSRAEVLGASWLYRYRCDALSNNPMYPHYGKIDQGTPDTDGTTKASGIYKTNISNRLIVSEAAADVPDPASDFFQIGVATSTALGSKAVNLYDCLCSLLVRVPTSTSVQLERGMARGVERGHCRGVF